MTRIFSTTEPRSGTDPRLLNPDNVCTVSKIWYNLNIFYLYVQS